MGRGRLLSVAVVGTLALGLPHSVTDPGRGRLAGVVLWGWERREDLRFIDAARVGVAFLAASVSLDGPRSFARFRAHPLLVPPRTALTAVVRIEASRTAALSSAQRSECVSVLRRSARLPGVSAVQIDFDARQSERDFYRGLLAQLRRELPSEMPLSITALASWCLDDPWIKDLPIDEAVPMLFRMGPSGPSIRERLARGEAFHTASCRGSVGVSLDEPPVTGLGSPRRFYVFSPRPWSPDTAREATLLGRP